MQRRWRVLTICFITIMAAQVRAADAPKTQPKKPPPRWLQMDYGPFLSMSIGDKLNAKFDNNTGHIEGDVVPRGIAIKLGDDWTSGVVFDADLCRLAYAWRGARLNFSGVIFDGGHGIS